MPTTVPWISESLSCGVLTALAFTLCFVVTSTATASTDNDVADAAASIAREPVRFAAGALDVPPLGAMAAAPIAWPPLVPDCTAAYLNASVAAGTSTPNPMAVVRVEVPAGRAVSLRGCRTSGVGGAADPLWHVRVVLAMGRSSAVALEAWDVEVGGVTIEGPAGNASSVVDALVVVCGGSRIVAGTSSSAAAAVGGGARTASSDPADDVHALSVVAPGAGAMMSVSGLGLVVAEGSVVRAQHDGAGVLYASACGVRAEAAQNSGAVAGPASLVVEGLRVVVTGQSSVEASTAQSGAEYSKKTARRAHAATIQAVQGARVSATRVAVAVLGGSTTAASGDDGSSAVGGIGVNGRERGSDTAFLPTTIAMTHATIIAAGPDTSVRVWTKGYGCGTAAMGVAARYTSATASMTNSAVYAVGPNTTVAVHVTGGGYGAAAMGVAANYGGATAFMTNTTLYVAGPNTTVVVHVMGGGGFGASAMGVAARYNCAASMTNTTVHAEGPNTTVAVHVTGGNGGAGTSAMGVAANYAGASASMTNTTVYAVGPNMNVAVHVSEGHGFGASAMGVAARANGATSMTNTTFYAVGSHTTVALHITGGGSGLGASAMGVGLADGGLLNAAGANTIARCPNVTIAGEGASDIVVFDAKPHSRVAFSDPPQCPPAPKWSGPLVLGWPATASGGTATGSASPGAPSPSRSESMPAVFETEAFTMHRTATASTAAADRGVVSPGRTLATAVASPSPGAGSRSRSTTAFAPSHTTPATGRPPDGDEPLAGPTVAIDPSPVPAVATASASVLAGVLLPSSASKPTGNVRALQVADVCLSAVGEGGALDAEAGEWPSDYAVVVARWEVGGDSGERSSTAKARAAGASVAVACAAVLCVAVLVRSTALPRRSGSSPGPRPGSREDGGGGGGGALRLQHSAAAPAPASALAVVFTVSAAYLVPNALEAAVVAATEGLGVTTGAAGAVAGCVMVASVVPVFAAPVIVVAAGESQGTEPPSVSLGGLVRRVAGFLDPVLVNGLRDEASPLLRAHALLDVAAACVIATASGATQGGVRVGGSCVLLALVMAVAAAGMTAYYVLVRPFAARLEVAVATAQAGTLAVLCGLTLAAVASGGAAVSGDALEMAGLAAEAVTFGAPVVLAVPVVLEWLREDRQGGGGREKDEDDEANAGVPAGISPTAVAQGGGAAVAVPAGGANAPLLSIPRHTGHTTSPGADGGTARLVSRNPLASAAEAPSA